MFFAFASGLSSSGPDLWVKQDMIRAGRHLINQTANLLELWEVVLLLCQHYKGIFTDKANQHSYQSGCAMREKYMLVMAHIKQGKGEMLPLNFLAHQFVSRPDTYGLEGSQTANV